MSQPQGEPGPTFPVKSSAAVGPDVRLYPSPESASLAVAHEIAGRIRERAAAGRDLVLGLATGSTPLGVYAELVRLHRETGLSMRHVVTFNLDEYWPIDPGSPQSFRAFMRRHLFDHVDIPAANIHIPDGRTPADQTAAAGVAYEQAIRAAGGIDLQLLGIGRSGHIGFNEPGAPAASRTRLVDLHQVTIDDLARATGDGAFGPGEDLPRQALTMGIASILSAREIVLLAFGSAKAGIVARALRGPVGPALPASYLRRHPRCRFILDRSAASELG